MRETRAFEAPLHPTYYTGRSIDAAVVYYLLMAAAVVASLGGRRQELSTIRLQRRRSSKVATICTGARGAHIREEKNKASDNLTIA